MTLLDCNTSWTGCGTMLSINLPPGCFWIILGKKS
jgi:hypothetical protein